MDIGLAIIYKTVIKPHFSYTVFSNAFSTKIAWKIKGATEIVLFLVGVVHSI